MCSEYKFSVAATFGSLKMEVEAIIISCACRLCLRFALLVGLHRKVGTVEKTTYPLDGKGKVIMFACVCVYVVFFSLWMVPEEGSKIFKHNNSTRLIGRCLI